MGKVSRFLLSIVGLLLMKCSAVKAMNFLCPHTDGSEGSGSGGTPCQEFCTDPMANTCTELIECAMVCDDQREICIHKTDGDDAGSLCICEWSDNSCKKGGVIAAVASSIGVFLIILIVVIGCCVWKRGPPCGRAKTRLSSSRPQELGVGGTDPEAQPKATDDEQTPEPPNEYSYAYGHVSRAPVDDPELAEGPDLDELQEDHYYSRLKTVHRKKDTDDKDKKPGTRPETGHVDSEETRKGETVQPRGGTLQDQDSGYEVARVVKRPGDDPMPQGSAEAETRPDSGYEIATKKTNEMEDKRHSCFTLEPPAEKRDSGYEVATATPAKEEKLHSYFTLEPPADKGDSGYEVATAAPAKEEKRHSYFTLEPPAEKRDSGYEVATAAPAKEDKRHSYFTLEPLVDDSGYEKVTELDRPAVVGALDISSDYDHLERPGPDLSKEGTISKI